MSTPADSSAELLTLHAIRLKGMADDADVAARFGLDLTLARELLLDFQAFGWITRVEFVGTAGWTLTESGRSENERQLAHELAATNSNSSIHDAYLSFLPHNDRLLRACTDWQLRPSGADPLAVNEHTDKEWDQRVLTTLSALREELRTICQELGHRLARFRGYDDRFTAALARVEQGELTWVARPRVDSCHTVWMELHEDLIATLGIRRGS
ncbi:MAG: transcriptional regulator [Propionibacteriaceae bacterium]